MKMTLMIGIKWEHIGLVEKISIYGGINLWKNNTYVELSKFVHSIQN
jgi:hypothetical protein